MSLNRFHRQIILPEVGNAGQARLKNARVLCVGVGGLGSPASLYLAAAGVGTLGLIDPDTVDETNLQRQILFRTSDEGSSKVHLAKARLQELNPEISVETYPESLNAHNAEQLFSRYDLVIDGTDNFATKFLINDAACKFQIPMVYGAVSGFEGQVALFYSKAGACYRCLYPEIPQSQIRNCAEVGVMGSVVGVIGSMQATLALEWLISHDSGDHPLYPKIGNLSIVDLKGSLSLRTLLVSKNPQCPTCSLVSEQIQLLNVPRDVCQSTNQLHPDELERLLGASPAEIALFDVREKEEWDAGHLVQARHFSLSRLERGELPEIHPGEMTIVLYCQSGMRSGKAVSILTQGLRATTTQVFHLSGGLNSWELNPRRHRSSLLLPKCRL